MASRKTIGFLFAGGSMLSVRNNTDLYCILKKEDISAWLSEVPEAGLLADLRPHFIRGEVDLFTLETIERIAAVIHEHGTEYDGFVVLARGEDIIRTALALEFMLQGFDKPIVVTGSRYAPGSIQKSEIRSIIKQGGLGLRSNVINALQIVSNESFNRTAIMFGNKVIEPTRAVVNDFNAMNLFRSIDGNYLGRVDFGISLETVQALRPKKNYYPHLSKTVGIIDYSSVRASGKPFSKAVFSAPAEALLIRLRENERIDERELWPALAAYPSVVLYNEQYVLQADGVIPLTNVTWDTAVMKTVWAHAAAKTPEDFAQLLRTNCLGEHLRS